MHNFQRRLTKLRFELPDLNQFASENQTATVKQPEKERHMLYDKKWKDKTRMKLDKLLDEGISDNVAIKITKKSKEQSETMARLQMMIEGLSKYRKEFHIDREPKYYLKRQTSDMKVKFEDENEIKKLKQERQQSRDKKKKSSRKLHYLQSHNNSPRSYLKEPQFSQVSSVQIRSTNLNLGDAAVDKQSNRKNSHHQSFRNSSIIPSEDNTPRKTQIQQLESRNENLLTQEEYGFNIKVNLNDSNHLRMPIYQRVMDQNQNLQSNTFSEVVQPIKIKNNKQINLIKEKNQKSNKKFDSNALDNYQSQTFEKSIVSFKNQKEIKTQRFKQGNSLDQKTQRNTYHDLYKQFKNDNKNRNSPGTLEDSYQFNKKTSNNRNKFVHQSFDLQLKLPKIFKSSSKDLFPKSLRRSIDNLNNHLGITSPENSSSRTFEINPTTQQTKLVLKLKIKSRYEVNDSNEYYFQNNDQNKIQRSIKKNLQVSTHRSKQPSLDRSNDQYQLTNQSKKYLRNNVKNQSGSQSLKQSFDLSNNQNQNSFSLLTSRNNQKLLDIINKNINSTPLQDDPYEGVSAKRTVDASNQKQSVQFWKKEITRFHEKPIPRSHNNQNSLFYGQSYDHSQSKFGVKYI